MTYRLPLAAAAVLLLAACQTAGGVPEPVRNPGQGLNRYVPDTYGKAAESCRFDGLSPATPAYETCVRDRALERAGKHP